jgi:hypothetical protein
MTYIGETTDSNRLVSQSTRGRFRNDWVAGWAHTNRIDQGRDHEQDADT